MRLSLFLSLSILLVFQSTHPHRVRLQVMRQQQVKGDFSIHAPTQGATVGAVSWIGSVVFQSTHPHRVRLIQTKKIERKRKFSIHAPTQGATKYSDYIIDKAYFSIHAPTQGATMSVSNPRTHTGCDARRVGKSKSR